MSSDRAVTISWGQLGGLLLAGLFALALVTKVAAAVGVVLMLAVLCTRWSTL